MYPLPPIDIQTETLELLEWPRLCQHLSTFAATKLGKIAAQTFPIPNRLTDSLYLLAQTREIYALELTLLNGLPFEGIQDIGNALERSALGGVLSGEELLNIATTLSGMRLLRRTIDAQDEDRVPTLLEIIANLRTHPELEQQIHHCIDEQGKVSDRASEKLSTIRQTLRSQRNKIYQTLQRLLQRQANAIQEQVITQREGRFVIPVKATHRDIISGIIHDTSISGATLYIEPHSVVEANNRLRQLTRQESVEEERICQLLSEQVAAVEEDLERLLAIATTLDLATARARYSLWLQGNPPRFIDLSQRLSRNLSPIEQGDEDRANFLTGHEDNNHADEQDSTRRETITLRGLRHPLLLWQQQYEQGPPVVPIDLQIDPDLRVVAITGPNTGGKTVTLKTLGLSMLMAKVGLFVPAKDPIEIPWFDRVLADIGDEQSLQQSLSTFSGHIKRIGRILDTVQQVPNALVLLDEIGAGTDPSEGSALAIALLKHLADQVRLTVATTHFGALKALKYEDTRFENASVEFDEVSLSPTYRLLWGIPGRSNALAIAQRLGLSQAVVDRAQQYVASGSSAEVNAVIAGLEAQRRRQEEKAQSAAQILTQAEQLYKEVSRKSAKLQEQEGVLKQHQEQTIQAEIAQAKAEIAQVIRTLQQGPQTAQNAQVATAAVEQIAAQHLPSQQPNPGKKSGFRPKLGDRIRILSLGHVAEVISEPTDASELTVRFGLMKMTVSLSEIESLQGEKVLSSRTTQEDAKLAPKSNLKSSSKSAAKSSNPSKGLQTKSLTGEQPDEARLEAPIIRTSKNTIDLRGSRVADAEIELDRWLAEAIGPFWIIHGHGTGKLRRGVHEFLKQHPGVDRFEAAAQVDGGTGVTVVYLK